MRRFVIIFGILGAVVFTAALLLPWWLGGVLPWVGHAFGLEFKGYTRNGYSRFKLESFEVRRAAVTVHVEAIEADTPLLWLWHCWTKSPRPVVAGAWRVDVKPRATGTGAGGGGGAQGWIPLKARLGAIADRLEFWLPEARVGPGIVRWPGHEIGFGPATWAQRTLSVADVGYHGLHGAPTLQLSADHELHLTLKMAQEAVSAVVSTQGTTVAGVVNGGGQPAELVAHFAEQGWTPRDAALRATQWEMPAGWLKLPPSYVSVGGAGLIEWNGKRLTAALSIDGVPRENANAPPLSAKIQGHMDAGEFVAETFSVDLPGLAARLSEPLAIDRQGRLRGRGARFTLEADLAKLPWGGLQGAVRGEALIAPGANREFSVDFSLEGEAVQTAAIAASRVELKGKLAWPLLEIAQGRIAFADGYALAVSGKGDLVSRTLGEVSVRGSIGRSTLQRWLPDKVSFDSVDLAAHASGPWSDLKHDGKISAKAIAFSGIKKLDAELDWQARGAAIESFELRAVAGQTKLAAMGVAERRRLKLTSMIIARRDGAELKLSRPATIHWGEGLEIDALSLAGGETALDATLHWATSGRVDLTGRGLGSAWLEDVIEQPKVAWIAESLALKGQWTTGPAVFTLDGRLDVDVGHGRSAQISIGAKGDTAGIDVETLHVAEAGNAIVKATGHLPIVLFPGRSPWFEVGGDAPFALDVATSPNHGFWKTFAELTGFQVVSPEVTARLEGTLSNPRGEAHLQAERVAVLQGRLDWRWPKIEALDLQLTASASGVKLDRFSVAVEGQAVRATGWLPVAAGGWSELLGDPTGIARRGDLHVEIPDADLAAVASYFPGYLAPKGRLQADILITSAEAISGFMRVKDATSRPLGPLGVLQEINAELQFSGRAVTLSAVTAKMGGQLVTLQGHAELPVKGQPVFDLALVGNNLPFVRQTGLLLRGDLDLKLSSAANGRAAISGVVRLRDSLFLSDLRLLIPSGQKGSAARAPYFAIEVEPLNRWRLDVAVEGNKFLRLRTPVFNGLASARFQLSGTLGAPVAVGEATVEEGSIRLPFANFAVQQGQVRLTPEQPDPQIYLTSATRRYGYDVRMELSGPAMAPIITFSSSPPLESEQVLLMVMAGQAPHDEVATTGRQRAARFGAFFGQSLIGTLGGDTEGADRLTISSGENVSAQGRETYSIEYRLNDSWAVTGEYDEFDEYYGGLKWRFYQKGGTRADEKK